MTGPAEMRVTGITTRILAYDLRPAWGDHPPEGIFDTTYRIPLDTLHTDEGIDGHAMQFGGWARARRWATRSTRRTPVSHRP